MKTNPNNKFTASHRILHWSIALFMFVLFITGFLRMYWMNKKTIVTAIDTTLKNQSIAIEKDQLTPIAKSIQAPMWEWHEWAAYVIAIVLLLRIAYMLLKGIKFPNPFGSHQNLKEKLQGYLYLLFYLFVVASTITGFYLKWGNGTYKQPMEAVHKWAIYWFPIFVVLHLVGILWAELTYKKGITSKMIGGDS
jgi:cytochrome b561